jgi:hypothetical protein
MPCPAEEEGKRRGPGRQVEHAALQSGQERLVRKPPLPSAVLSERERACEGVVSGRDPPEDGLGVARPVPGIGRPALDPGGQMANQ